MRRAGLLGDLACAVNVIQRPGRQSSLEASRDLRAAGVHPAWHLATRGKTRAELAGELEVAREADIRQVLCLLGDHDVPDGTESVSIRDAVAMVREALPEAFVGATLNQYARDPEAALRNLLPKLKAGARYIQTQPVFAPERLAPLVERVRAEFPDARVVGMVMPLLSADEAVKMASRLRVELPPELLARLDGGHDGAWQAFEETVGQVVACGIVDGVAVMTFEMDPPAETGTRIAEVLRRARSRPGHA